MSPDETNDAPSAKARIDGVLATKASVVLVFRRGPSALTQQLLWNLDTDKVAPGEWIKASVYTRRCDLSPNGKYLVGFYSDYSPAHKKRTKKDHGVEAACWTAVSFAGSFKPLALWLQANSYFGGGQWIANGKLEIDPQGPHEAVPPPPDLRVKRTDGKRLGQVGLIWAERLERRGWIRVKSEGRLKASGFAMAWIKKTDKGRLVYQSTREDDAGDETWTLFDAKGNAVRTWNTPLGKPMFIDFDRRGRLVFGEEGCLYAWENWPEGEPRLIADLNANAPT